MTCVGCTKLFASTETFLGGLLLPPFFDVILANDVSGAERGADGSSRRTREEARSTCVRFSPTGREWAACTTDGLLLYSLDEAAVFDPSDLDESVTPEAVQVRLCFPPVRLLVGLVRFCPPLLICGEAVRTGTIMRPKTIRIRKTLGFFPLRRWGDEELVVAVVRSLVFCEGIGMPLTLIASISGSCEHKLPGTRVAWVVRTHRLDSRKPSRELNETRDFRRWFADASTRLTNVSEAASAPIKAIATHAHVWNGVRRSTRARSWHLLVLSSLCCNVLYHVAFRTPSGEKSGPRRC